MHTCLTRLLLLRRMMWRLCDGDPPMELAVVPVSVRDNLNVVRKPPAVPAERSFLTLYRGPTLLEALLVLSPVALSRYQSPFRGILLRHHKHLCRQALVYVSCGVLDARDGLVSRSRSLVRVQVCAWRR
jgi:hypothetical protein